MNRVPVVLVCPLNWGLGHATRCMPIVDALLERGFHVVVVADGSSMAFLQEEYGTRVGYVKAKQAEVRYTASGGWMWLALLRQVPRFILSMRKARATVEGLVQKMGACAVISDNHYGMYSKKVPSVLMTHQLFLRPPSSIMWAAPLLEAMIRKLTRPFWKCWVPDFPGKQNLSGELSHKKMLSRLHFVGPLSRFSRAGLSGNPTLPDLPGDYILAIVSGPEPQRQLFEELLTRELLQLDVDAVLLRGRAGESSCRQVGRVWVMDHAPTHAMQVLLRDARLVVSRSGYSTLMDLSVFGKKALLVPTPGQTEQEYLGRLMEQRSWAACMDQKHLELGQGIDKALEYAGIPVLPVGLPLLSKALDELLAEVSCFSPTAKSADDQ